MSYIHGPPGTGKSTFAKFLMSGSQHIRQQFPCSRSASQHSRILVLSTTNDAVDNLILKYKPSILTHTITSTTSIELVRLGKGTSYERIKAFELNQVKKRLSSTNSSKSSAAVLSESSIVAGTFGTAIRMEWSNVTPFDMIIVDEAAHARESLVIATLSTIIEGQADA